jgi:hypothetical protein
MSVADRATSTWPKAGWDRFGTFVDYDRDAALIEHTVDTVREVLLEKAVTLDSVNARTTARVLRGIVQEVFES